MYVCVCMYVSAIVVMLIIRSSSYVTSSTSEVLVSVQLPLIFCHAEILGHVVLRRNSVSM